MRLKYLSLMVFTAILLTACEKDEDNTPSPSSGGSNTTTEESSIQFGDADGTLIAVKSKSNTGIITIQIGTAVASFFNGGNLTDVGTISVEGTEMTKNSNNSYTATASASSPTGISYSLPIEWAVSGANGFSAFTENISRDFPQLSDVNSGGTVDKSDGYTLSTASVSNSDSVLFSIGNVHKILAGNTNSCTFSSADLASLGNGTNVASIAPYNFSSKAIGGKKIYFVNESVVQKNVSIQD